MKAGRSSSSRTPAVNDASETITTAARRRVLRFRLWFDSISLAQSVIVVFSLFAVIYLASASYDENHWDTYSASVPAWRLGTSGTLVVDEFLGITPWFVDTGNGVFSNRFPGVIFVAVPAYWLAELVGAVSAEELSFVPAALTAALVTAAAMAVLYMVFQTLATREIALLATMTAGFATATWAVSADALWSHGPTQLYLASCLLALSQARHVPAGFVLGLATFTRPHLAIVALALGVHEAIRHRSPWPAMTIGALSALGLAAVIVYNRSIFGGWSISGGYGGYPGENFTGMSALNYLTNWLLTLFSPVRGLILFSPFLVLAALGIPEAWRAAPNWVKASALSGLAYLALQLRINHNYSGGDTFFSYRLPLEAVTLAAPLLLLASLCWIRRGGERVKLYASLVIAAVMLQGFGAVVYDHLI